MDGRKGTRGWVIVVLVAVVALGFYLAGREAVSELTANGQLQTTEQRAR